MQISTFTKSILAIGIAVATLAIACKKDNSSSSGNNGNDSTAINMSGSSSTADNAYNDVLQLAIESGSDNNISYLAAASHGAVEANSTHGGTTVNGGSVTCASYTLTPADDSTFPKTLVVDFGSGCTSSDGITRKGQVTFVFSGRIFYPGTTVSASFQDYSVNGYQLEGTYSITNTSSQTTLSYHTSVTDGRITFPDASYYTYTGGKSVTMVAGYQTPTDLSDDVYSITGSNTIGSSAGNTLYDSVTTALTKTYSCQYISSGIVAFTYNGTLNGTVDFGAGDCDNLATVKIGSMTATIHMQ